MGRSEKLTPAAGVQAPPPHRKKTHDSSSQGGRGSCRPSGQQLRGRSSRLDSSCPSPCSQLLCGQSLESGLWCQLPQATSLSFPGALGHSGTWCGTGQQSICSGFSPRKSWCPPVFFPPLPEAPSGSDPGSCLVSPSAPLLGQCQDLMQAGRCPGLHWALLRAM